MKVSGFANALPPRPARAARPPVATGPQDSVALSHRAALPSGVPAVAVVAPMLHVAGQIAVDEVQKSAQRLSQSGFDFHRQTTSFWGREKWVQASPTEVAQELEQGRTVEFEHAKLGHQQVAQAQTLTELDAFYGGHDTARLESPMLAGALLSLAGEQGYQAYQTLKAGKELEMVVDGETIKSKHADTWTAAAYFSKGFGEAPPRAELLTELKAQGYELAASPFKVWRQQNPEVPVSYRGLGLGQLDAQLSADQGLEQLAPTRHKIDTMYERLGESANQATWNLLGRTDFESGLGLLDSFERKYPEPVKLLAAVIDSRRPDESLAEASAPLESLGGVGDQLIEAYSCLRSHRWQEEQTQAFSGLLARGASPKQADKLVARYDKEPDKVKNLAQLLDTLKEVEPKKALGLADELTAANLSPDLETVSWLAKNRPLDEMGRAYQLLSQGGDRELLARHSDLGSFSQTSQLLSEHPELRQGWEELVERLDGDAAQATRLLGEGKTDVLHFYPEVAKQAGDQAEQVWSRLKASPDLETACGFYHLSGTAEKAVALTSHLCRRDIPGADQPLEARRAALATLLEANQGKTEQALADYDFLAARSAPLGEAGPRLARLIGASDADQARLAFVACEREPELYSTLAATIEATGSFRHGKALARGLAEHPERKADLQALAPLSRQLRNLLGVDQVAALNRKQLEQPLSASGVDKLQHLFEKYYGLDIGGSQEGGLVLQLGKPTALPAEGQLAVNVTGSDKVWVEASVDGGDWQRLTPRSDAYAPVTASGKQARLRLRADDTEGVDLSKLQVKMGTAFPDHTISIHEVFANQSVEGKDTVYSSNYVSIPPDTEAIYQVTPDVPQGAYLFLEAGDYSQMTPIRSYSGYTPVDETVSLSEYANKAIKLQFRLKPAQYLSASLRCTDILLRRKIGNPTTLATLPSPQASQKLLELAYAPENPDPVAFLNRLDAMAEQASLEEAVNLWSSLGPQAGPDRVEALSYLTNRLGDEEGRKQFEALEQSQSQVLILDRARLTAGRKELAPFLSQVEEESVDAEALDSTFTLLARCQQLSDAATTDAIWSELRVPQGDETQTDRVALFDGLVTLEKQPAQALASWRKLEAGRDPANRLEDMVRAYEGLHKLHQGDSQKVFKTLEAVQGVQATGRFPRLGLAQLLRYAVQADLLAKEDLTQALLASLSERGGTADLEVGEDRVRVGDFELEVAG
ncbi:MAG: hypothetical protein KC910_09165 [Candidatus Eremiobacteraeota bacterium]|nr:hypothetical protein [Candidatus Eremiobacteraeota bacterium]